MSLLPIQHRDVLSKGVVVLCALPALVIPTTVLCYIFWQAMPVLSLSFIFGSADGVGFGVTEGIFPQLVVHAESYVINSVPII